MPYATLHYITEQQSHSVMTIEAINATVQSPVIILWFISSFPVPQGACIRRICRIIHHPPTIYKRQTLMIDFLSSENLWLLEFLCPYSSSKVLLQSRHKSTFATSEKKSRYGLAVIRKTVATRIFMPLSNALFQSRHKSTFTPTSEQKFAHSFIFTVSKSKRKHPYWKPSIQRKYKVAVSFTVLLWSWKHLTRSTVHDFQLVGPSWHRDPVCGLCNSHWNWPWGSPSRELCNLSWKHTVRSLSLGLLDL